MSFVLKQPVCPPQPPAPPVYSAIFMTTSSVQIVGDIRASRNALIQITSRIRSYLYHDISLPKELPLPPVSTPGRVGNTLTDASSPNRNSAHEDYQGSDNSTTGYKTMQTATTPLQVKVAVIDYQILALIVFCSIDEYIG